MDIKNLTLEKIEKYDLEVYQDGDHFKFGIDAFCLARFCNRYVKKADTYMDMCSGTGIVGLLINRTIENNKSIYIEKNPYYCSINKLNLIHNNMAGQVYNLDIKNLRENFEDASVDYISINPPYMQYKTGLATRSLDKDQAKIEDSEDFLTQVFSSAFYLLRDRGQLFMVHRVERLVDIFIEARKNKMEPKTIQYIRNVGSKKASIVLVRFVKNGRKFLENLDDLIIGG